jgi:hypothetical protein
MGRVIATPSTAGERVMSKSNVRTTAFHRRRDDVPPADHQRAADTEAIAKRAYERFEQRGREHGRDLEDWLDAERELRAGRPDVSK